jgi:taurine dioxygenase
MTLHILTSKEACGARVEDVDLSQPLSPDMVAALRTAWLEHQVLAFPGQNLGDDDLERFSCYFGPFGDDPFIAPIPGRQHVIAVERRANEAAPIFAESWHTDWSFQARPPSGTCLLGITIPPQGGDTLFANQQLALQKMPAQLRERVQDLVAMHSAKMAYAPEGMYGDADASGDRSMDIRPSSEAHSTQHHPLICRHEETGVERLYGCIGYIIGFENMADAHALDLLLELHEWQTREEFIYRHQWEEGMLIMWDNRSVLHRATAGYEGYDRLLHRTTIGAGHGARR